jgi:branched-chain amino acid transport system ATP-binding protein
MLTIKNLYAGYKHLEVLKDVNIEVGDGEIVALIGPNGAGKSTVIKSIFSIADVKKGKIMFDGDDIARLKTHQLIAKGISFVTQGKVNFSNLTVRENLEIGATLVKNKNEVAVGLRRVFKQFPVLKERQSDLAFGLSGGQQQMLALGRALMINPKLLLLDEPSLGLSPKLQKEVFNTIQDLRKNGLSLLIVEQNAKKAIEIADKTYLLENGEIVLMGGKDIVKHKKIKEVYLGG